MDELAIKRMMDYYGGDRQDCYRKASDAIEYLIKDLQRLKDKIDREKMKEPHEHTTVYAHQLPTNTMNIIRNNLIAAEKCDEALNALSDLLPEPDAE